MIAITNLDGNDLHLLPGQSLTIEQAAGWLADEDLPGAFSYPIGFPLDEHNNRFLSHQYRPDHALPEMEMPVIVRLEGVLYRRCTLSYRVQEGKGDGFLKIDAGEVYEKLKKLSLQQAFTEPIPMGDGLFFTIQQRMKAIALLDPGEFPLTFFPIRNELFFEPDLATKYPGFINQPYVNQWNHGDFTATRQSEPICPQFYLVWVLQKIYALAGYRITGDWISREETQRLTIFNLTALRTVPAGGLLFAQEANTPLCLPEMSVPDFLKAVRQRYGLIFSFNANDQTVSIRRFVDVLARPQVQDLTPYQLTGYSVDAAKGDGYSFTDTPDSADALYKDVNGDLLTADPIVLGKGRQPIELKITTPQMIYEPSLASTRLFGGYWLVPTVRMPGNVLNNNLKLSSRYAEPDPKTGIVKLTSPVKLSLLSYRGMQPDSKNQLYPLGTSGNSDGKQIPIPGAEATTLGGRYGVYRKSLRAYYYFRDQTRPVMASALLPATVLSELAYDQPVSLCLSGDVRRSYLPDKTQCEAPGIDGLVRVRFTALTLPTGIDLPSEVDEPVIWVSLTIVEVAGQGPIIPNGNVPTFIEKAATLTLRFWLNAAKTVPAVVNNFTVSLREKKTFTPVDEYQPAPTYVETVSRFYANGQQMILTGPYYTRRTRYENRLIKPALLFENYVAAYQLDPSDDYIILP